MFDITQRWPLTLDRRGWLFTALGFLVVLYLFWWLDVPIALWAQELPQPVHDFFAWITEFGESGWVLIPALLLLIVCAFLALVIPAGTHRRALLQMTGIWAFIVVAVGLPGLFTAVIKRLIGRARPELLEDPEAALFMMNLLEHTYQSFPSGHATTAFGFGFVVAFMAPRWLPLALIYAVLVGFSRVAIGAHYATDAISGMAIGILGAYAVRNFFAERGWVFKVQPDGSVVMRDLAAVRRAIRRR